ncbi:NAD-dependent DNA ligase LigA [bacterium]|nr:NAD-dependent DNA ligase LigA [bacterium]
MTPSPAKGQGPAQRLESLRAEILRHDQLYYNDGRIEISDAEYDALFRELKALEAEHPELVTPESPTQRVGAPLPEGDSFDKVRHAVSMLSIESLRSEDEARDFASKVHRFLGLEEGSELTWHVEPKFDGVSAALIYRDGAFVQGLTRGDGTTGEDITANLRTVRDVPVTLGLASAPRLLEVRGEVLIARERFDRFNVYRQERDQPTLANARNATAGALRRSDPSEVRRYPLEFHPYTIVRCEGLELPTSHAARLALLAEWGFSPPSEDATVMGIDGCLEYHAGMEARRDEIPFEMDGIVAKLDDVELRDRLGSTARATKWQYAHKFAPVEATTTLRAIEIQVGVNGRLTPRAHVDPVEVLGVTVRHTTLHNEDYVLTLGARPGDRVLVKRAGDVIQLVEVVLDGVPALDGEHTHETARVWLHEICPVHHPSQALGVPSEQVVGRVEEGVRPPLGGARLPGIGPVNPGGEDHRGEASPAAPDEVQVTVGFLTEVMTEVEGPLEGVRVAIKDGQHAHKVASRGHRSPGRSPCHGDRVE